MLVTHLEIDRHGHDPLSQQALNHDLVKQGRNHTAMKNPFIPVEMPLWLELRIGVIYILMEFQTP